MKQNYMHSHYLVTPFPAMTSFFSLEHLIVVIMFVFYVMNALFLLINFDIIFC